MKKSVQLTHPIRHDRSGKMQHDEFSRKAELPQPSDGMFKLLQTRIGKQYANMLEEYDTWSQVSIELLKATYGQASGR